VARVVLAGDFGHGMQQRRKHVDEFQFVQYFFEQYDHSNAELGDGLSRIGQRSGWRQGAIDGILADSADINVYMER
jgi:hypothetical protein